MSRITLANIVLATTPEEKAAAKAAHAADLANQPTDSEIITNFLRNCTNGQGEPILQRDEMADLNDSQISFKKSHS
ncbi:TPA: hypothetical protein JG825_003492 [Vibrio parahaemolyticus]|uniref:hypothetical protein n=1 Tax=Vibrio harveyi group TaxID=717610 RepID=UPI0018F12F0C|nr:MULTISPECIES: hypothetical protein [Vibrio harveyi group]MCR9909703.1 hypothetical protein [Vibrio campbellii]UPR19046.1 hypothetical protein H9J99_26220 [Vibrio parahaemolyticus]HAV1520173.1 hypothetical protein [Vibrio parahaemolyticus]HAV1539139.1 hypothetical protein [Vibrio parahaemolyticus]